MTKKKKTCRGAGPQLFKGLHHNILVMTRCWIRQGCLLEVTVLQHVQQCFKHPIQLWKRKKNPLMTKTSLDVYMLFTLFINLNDAYELLFNICNTDTNLYDFYIKNISSSAGNRVCFHLWINMFLFMDFKFELCCCAARPECKKDQLLYKEWYKQFFALVYTYISYKNYIQIPTSGFPKCTLNLYPNYIQYILFCEQCK